MTAKEQLLEEAPGWSEHDAEIALRAVEREHAGGSVDEWGSLSKLHDVAFGETMRRLAEEEREAGRSRGEARRGLVGRTPGLADRNDCRRLWRIPSDADNISTFVISGRFAGDPAGAATA